jgi:CheY-like chemotaxis protein
MNLIINAAEAISPEGGNVRISTDRVRLEKTTFGFYPGEELPAGDYVALAIRDDGHGMTEETRARIFDPFFTTKFTGRGLGLAAALGIVRGHRSGITVESAAGVGTTFRIYFPVGTYPGAVQAEPASAVEGPVAYAGHGTVLVVDDEEIVRNVARHALERFGYRVLLAEDGQQAMDIFASDRDSVGLVLLDMEMPGMGGVETLKRLRQMHPGVMVVASSGYSESDAMAQFGPGLAGFLQKPYPARDLAAKVHAVLHPEVAV